jgi:uncharacterized OB-fold protein
MDKLSPWRDGLQHGVLRYQRCAECGAAQTLARCACTACGGTHLAWHDASGDGTVYAVTVVQRAPSDAFRALVPYTLLLVDLDEGARVMAHGTPGLAIGDAVTASFHDLAGQRLAVFIPRRR